MENYVIDKLCGWRNRPDEVKRILSAKAKPTFQDAAPNLSNFWQGEEIGLWRAAQKVQNGKHLPADKQTIGDCVSHGNGRGVDYLHCVKEAAGLVASGSFIEGKTSCKTEYVYGTSREEGGGLGPQDGSVGAWAVESLAKDGYSTRDGVPYDGQIAKQWGWRGVPAAEKTKGKLRTLVDYALVESVDDMRNALKAGSPIPICSDQGFSMTRDANGICRAQGSWAHCMLVIGMYKVSDRWIYVILQSWGQNTPSGPTPMGEAPDNSFGCEESTMSRILRQRDSFALKGIAGDTWEPITSVDWIM